jgi:hypothetical protein
MRHLKKIFESIKGWTKEKVRKELYSNCDSEIEKLQRKMNDLITLRDNLDTDLGELDFYIRANFLDQPGFSHYFFDEPGHSSDYVKCKLEVVFNTNDLSRDELLDIVKDFLNDCKELKSIFIAYRGDIDIYEGSNWSNKKGWRYIAYISSQIKKKDR